MEQPPAKRMRLDQAADVGSNLPFLHEGAPIDLENLCRSWEEQPLDFKRPLVFFTVGRIAVLSSSSGVPDTGSLCRQFWNWLGQPDPYRPDQIAFKMVNGRGIYMSLPNLTQFKVKFPHGPELESIITLESKEMNQGLTAKTIMTRAYPPTAFRTCPWYRCSEEVLVNIEAFLSSRDEKLMQSPKLHIAGFYSKAADFQAAPWIEEQSEEEILLRGAGRRLLCLMLDTIQWTHAVTLNASGLSYRDKVLLDARAKSMQAEDMMANLEEEFLEDLKELNPHMLEQWKSEREATNLRTQSRKQFASTLEHQREDLEALRADWVDIRGNQNLVAYYMKNFGFKPLKFDDVRFVGMEATPEMIHARCQTNAEKDGDCNEVIVSRDVERAASQIESLRACKNIRILYLHGVKALPSVEELLTVTKAVGVLGLTSLFDLEAIEELLTSRQQMTVQIDCLCLDRSSWSAIVQLAESEAWPRLYIRSVVATSFDAMEVFYDDVMNVLEAKTGAIYHKVSGVLPYYMETKVVDRAVWVKGEEMTEVGSRLYNDAGTKINSGPIV
jgi:hypothetical protein